VTIFLACLLAVVPSLPPAARHAGATASLAQAAADSSALVRRFVQESYDWYVPLAHRTDAFPAYVHLLGRRPPLLTHRLATALRADSVARRDAAAKRALLDFDPFLNAQDPCDAYQAGAVRRARGAFLVTVRARCADPRWQQDPITVTVTVEEKALRIANVAGPRVDVLRLLCVSAAGGTLEAGILPRCR